MAINSEVIIWTCVTVAVLGISKEEPAMNRAVLLYS